MISALTTAFDGLKTATAQADKAAATIVQAGFDSATPAGFPPAVVGTTGMKPQTDVLQGMMDFQQAALAYKANLKVAETASEMEKTLLRNLP